MAGHLEKKPIEEEFEAEEQTKTTQILKYKEQAGVNPDAYQYWILKYQERGNVDA